MSCPSMVPGLLVPLARVVATIFTIVYFVTWAAGGEIPAWVAAPAWLTFMCVEWYGASWRVSTEQWERRNCHGCRHELGGS